MAQVGLKRQLAPGLHISSVLGISQLGETETIERTCKAQGSRSLGSSDFHFQQEVPQKVFRFDQFAVLAVLVCRSDSDQIQAPSSKRAAPSLCLASL